jgi:prohibitin 1
LTETGTKDLQKVMLKIRLFYKPIEEFLPKIHLELNRDYMKKILPALANEVSKSIIAKYDAETMLKNWESVSNEIKNMLIARAEVFNLVLQDVSIYELQFGAEFMNSIEKKQVAQQEAEMYKYKVM